MDVAQLSAYQQALECVSAAGSELIDMYAQMDDEGAADARKLFFQGKVDEFIDSW